VVGFGSAGDSVFTQVEADPQGNALAVTKISSPGKLIQYRALPFPSLNGEKPGTVMPATS
jgi:hypothetical protein